MCNRCEIGEHQEGNDDMLSLEEALLEADDQDREMRAMTQEDRDVIWTTVLRPRELLRLQIYKGVTAGDLHQQLSKKKRVRQSAHMVMKPVESNEPLLDESLVAWIPCKTARGGGYHRILIKYDDHEFYAAFAAGDAVADLLAQLGKPDAILRWRHYWLHHSIDLLDFEQEMLSLEMLTGGPHMLPSVLAVFELDLHLSLGTYSLASPTRRCSRDMVHRSA